jgi:hypothetical protein
MTGPVGVGEYGAVGGGHEVMVVMMFAAARVRLRRIWE